jgi:2-polyprenyl-3-methyl-5-hydroxy-6-metoxy-1,4-benzoquinol methylase
MTLQAMEDTTVAIAERCWCGSVDLFPAPHPSYLVCRDCGTAKLQDGLATGQDLVVDEKSHLYGEQYWKEHMLGYGYPPLAERARRDLTERDQYWMQHLLKYRLPPGKTLELGCAHGAFVKLLGAAGFQSSGMEMSPAIIARAREWFGVEMIRGPIEHADRPLGSYDVILMFDVLEHFAKPVETMSAILELVADDGLVVIQTPVYRTVTDAKWFQFKPPEHTFLFSPEGIRGFFRRMGFNHLAEEAAIFRDDQFLFASRRPLPVNPPERIAEQLATTADGRLVLAMQEMYRDLRALERMDPAERYGVRALGKAFVRASLRKMGLRP